MNSVEPKQSNHKLIHQCHTLLHMHITISQQRDKKWGNKWIQVTNIVYHNVIISNNVPLSVRCWHVSYR